jgi:hypothetical protein
MDTFNINVRITRQRLSEQQQPQPQPPAAGAPPDVENEITLDTSGESVIKIAPPRQPTP